MAEVGFILQVGHIQVDEVTFSFSHMLPWRANWLGHHSLSAFSSNIFAERSRKKGVWFFNVNIRLTFSDTSHPLKILLYMFWDEINYLLTFLSLSTCSLFGTETATIISYQLKFLYVECTLPLVRKEEDSQE